MKSIGRDTSYDSIINRGSVAVAISPLITCRLVAALTNWCDSFTQHRSLCLLVLHLSMSATVHLGGTASISDQKFFCKAHLAAPGWVWGFPNPIQVPPDDSIFALYFFGFLITCFPHLVIHRIPLDSATFDSDYYDIDCAAILENAMFIWLPGHKAANRVTKKFFISFFVSTKS